MNRKKRDHWGTGKNKSLFEAFSLAGQHLPPPLDPKWDGQESTLYILPTSDLNAATILQGFEIDL